MWASKRYLWGSTAMAAAIAYHAFSTREQFFPAVVYLASSKVAIATFGNLAFAWALWLYRAVTKVFLGTLRAAEVERRNERISQAVMETLLAMTIFRDEFNTTFVAMFGILIFLKVFHWLVQDRVEFLDTTPVISRITHARIVTFMSLLLFVDLMFLQYTVAKTLQRSASVHLLFGFEYIIQASVIVSVSVKYFMSVYDASQEGRWENKGLYVFYLELMTDMLHLFVYTVFFVIVFMNYGIPLHLVRDLYWTFKNFRNRVADFVRYRKIAANMESQFPDASAEDLAGDNVCIICREEMTGRTRNKKLACGHVFHLHCLRSWLERQQNCPTCRSPVVAAAPANPTGLPANANGAQPNVQPDANVANQQPGHQQHVAANVPQNGGTRAPAPQAGQQVAVGGQPGQPQQQHWAAWPAPQYLMHPGQYYNVPPAPGAAGGGSPAAQGQPQYTWASAYAGGYIWNPPQWGVPASMALYIPAHVQYAGQTMPLPESHASQGVSLPVLPLVLPQTLGGPGMNPTHGITPPPPSASETEHRRHHQALTAAHAAAAVASSIYGSPLMLPPSMLDAESRRRNASVAGAMTHAQRQEVASSSAAAVEQAILRSLDVLQDLHADAGPPASGNGASSSGQSGDTAQATQAANLSAQTSAQPQNGQSTEASTSAGQQSRTAHQPHQGFASGDSAPAGGIPVVTSGGDAATGRSSEQDGSSSTTAQNQGRS